ncbi:hypothetical protein V6N12_028807 [Hibiscus sabdariffa]|uniref:RNase H type-1 domain-containing protein n=1 Tax=Hibiscus sabdariffa TaxID=183260 RepID=A0ABR2F6Y2_9ROSI
MDCRRLVVESDNADALKAISRGLCNNGHIALLRYIIGLCNQDWNVSFAQVMHGNNRVADCLSKMALEGDFRAKRFDDPPLEVLPMLSIDVSG